MSDEIKIPGAEIERAAAGELTRAGQTLLGAVAGLFERWTIVGNVEAKAKAVERAKDIKQEGALKRQKNLAEARYAAKLAEIESRARLEQRAAGRLQAGWLRDQENVETIARQGIEYANQESDAEPTRQLESDWLLRFFQYAATVDDQQLQAVMARALADASIASKPLTSRRAIDTIRFFEATSYQSFQFVAKELTLFGIVPTSYFSLRRSAAPADFDLSELLELGLIKLERSKFINLALGQLTFNFTIAPRQAFTFECVMLTQIGREIAALLFPEVRNRFPASNHSLDTQVLWGIQTNLAINEPQVEAAATAIVQEASDYWDIACHIFYRTTGEARTLFQGSRDAIEQPFGIPDLDFSDQQVEPYLCVLANIVTGAFRYFDEQQLPSMIFDAFASSSQGG